MHKNLLLMIFYFDPTTIASIFIYVNELNIQCLRFIYFPNKPRYNRKYSTVFCICSSVETCMVCIRLLSLTKTMENRVALLSLTATLYVRIMTL